MTTPISPPRSRNDPCPCGSGQRYKHCHGAQPAATAPSPSRAVASDPTTPPDAAARAGVAAHASGDLATAERRYSDALAVHPEHPTALHYLGVLRYQQGRLDDALPLLERSVALVPGEPEFHNNLGLALAAAQRDADAIDAYERALARKPDHAGALSNLGLARQNRRDIDGAVAAFRRGLAVAPDFPQLHWNLALALLLRGDYAQGWKEYEWRLRTPEFAAALAHYPGAVWRGDDPAGRTVLVTCEQGLGDSIQHLRFVQRLAARGARVVVVVPAALERLAASAPGVAAVVREGTPLPAFDARASLMSLPYFLEATQDDIGMRAPYLHSDATRVPAIDEAMRPHRRALNVGVAWSGAPGNTHNTRRSMPLAMLAPLFAYEDVQLFSLKRDGEPVTPGDAPWVERLVRLDARNDFDDLAALVERLDLVVSVDTSIAHLAGALGKTVWVPLAYVPDWRWHLDRADSPWYPTARLFRQQAPAQWSGVVDELEQALRERLHRR